MASPHAVGVAALIVAQFGRPDPVNGGVTLEPSEVERVLRATAVDHACPEPRLFEYPDPALGPEFDAFCEGDAAFNGFYGDGIANAARAVSFSGGAAAPAAAPPAPSGGQLGATFQTRVLPRRISLATRVRRAGRGLRLRISGRLTPPTGMSAKEACGSGVFTVLVQSQRKKTLAVRETRLRASCAYRLTVRFARRTGLSRALRVRVVFRGNDRLKQRRAPLATSGGAAALTCYGTTIGLTLSGSSRPARSAASASSRPKWPEMIAFRSTLPEAARAIATG